MCTWTRSPILESFVHSRIRSSPPLLPYQPKYVRETDSPEQPFRCLQRLANWKIQNFGFSRFAFENQKVYLKHIHTHVIRCMTSITIKLRVMHISVTGGTFWPLGQVFEKLGWYLSSGGVTVVHSVRCKCTFLHLGAHLGHRGWHFGCGCVQCAPSWVLYVGSRCNSLLLHSNICRNIHTCSSVNLHKSPSPHFLFPFCSSYSDVFKVDNCGRGASTCATAVPLFTCLHLCTCALRTPHNCASQPPTSWRISHHKCAQFDQKVSSLEGACMTFRNCAFQRC